MPFGFLGVGVSDEAKPTSLESNIRRTCFAFTAFWFACLAVVSDGDFSSVLTFGALSQFLGFVLLCLRVKATQSVAGLSAQSLVLFALYFGTRLTSTCLKNGYIPVDRTGDYVYQLCDFGSLCCVAYLLRAAYGEYGSTYQAAHDQMELMPLVIPAVLLGFCIRGDFNGSPVYDGIWSVSLNLETLAFLPQLAMLSTLGGTVDAATSRFVACMVLSSVCRFLFWWYAHTELIFFVAGYYIVAAHGLQLILCAGFMFEYTKSWINGASLALPSAEAKLAPAQLVQPGRQSVIGTMPEEFDGLPSSWR